MKCLFCKIASKQISSSAIFEEKEAIAFLDIHPCASGHTVVISRRHAETILDLSLVEITSVFELVQKVTKLLKQKLNPLGFTIGINHGSAAGQVVPHFHVHIIPRFYGDGGKSIHSVVGKINDSMSIEEVYKKIND